jgi:hypothetical protein
MGGWSPTALAVSLAAAACVWQHSHATTVGDDCTFEVDVGGVSWFVGGVGRVHVEGQWHAPRVPRPIKTTHSSPSADSSPHSTSVTREQRAGVDHVGEYTATRCGWTVGDVEVDTTVTVYVGRNATVSTITEPTALCAHPRIPSTLLRHAVAFERLEPNRLTRHRSTIAHRPSTSDPCTPGNSCSSMQ